MDMTKAWYILQMEETTDEAAVKAQYRKLLPLHNPEDDPDGFRALREAYEAVLAYIKNGGKTTEEAAKEERPKDEIDLWVDQFRDIYQYMDMRIDPNIWKEKLDDPLCVGLDTAYEARERLLVFLMEHHYLPKEVWKVLDQALNITAERDDLVEKFAANFIDYVIYQTKNETFGSYPWFTYLGADEGEAEYDRYLDEYYSLNSRVRELDDLVENEILKDADEEDKKGDTVFSSTSEILAKEEDLAKQADELQQGLDALSAYEIYHPYEDLERIHLALIKEEDHICKNGKEETLEAAARRLLEKYSDPYILRVCGEALAAADLWEEALPLWEKALEEIPDHSTTLYDKARYYHHKGDFEKAETIIRENISSLNGSAKIKNLFLKVQQDMHDHYKKILTDDPDNMDAYMEYCWALFHSDRTAETMEALKKHTYTEGTSEYYDYVDMMGRCYLDQKQYEEAYPYLKQWEKALAELPDDGSEKFTKRKKTLGYQYFTIADCLYHLAMIRKEDPLYKEAEDYLKKGIDVEDDRSMLYPYEDLLARIYLHSDQDNACIELADRQLEKDANFLPAYLRRQEAYYHLHNGQGVIDDYHNILNLYRDYYRPYVLAIRVFMIYNQPEDALSVFKDAEENNIDHPALRAEKLRYLRRLPHSDENREQIENGVKELLEKIKDQKIEVDTPPDDVITEDHAWFELAAAYTEYDMDEKALDLVNDRISKGATLKGLFMLQANLHRMLKHYDEALKCYDAIAKDDPKNPNIAYYRALCYLHTNVTDQAIRYFKEAVELDPEEDRAVYELARIYRNRFKDYRGVADYKRSLDYFNRLVELNPSPFVYSERALLLRLRGDLKATIADLETALEKDPTGEHSDDYLRYRLGDMYFLNRQPEKAEEQFKKAIEQFGDHQSAPIFQIADLYGTRGDWEGGARFLQKYSEKYQKNRDLQIKLAEFLIASGHCDEAEKIYTFLRDEKIINEKEYHFKWLKMHALAHPEQIVTYIRNFEKPLQKVMKIDNQTGFVAKMFPSMNAPAPTTKEGKEKLESLAEYYAFLGEMLLYARQLKQSRKYLEKAREYYSMLGRKNLSNYRCLALCYKLLGEGKVSVMELPLNPSEYSPLRGRDYDKVAAEYARMRIQLLLTQIKRPKDVIEENGGQEKMQSEEYFFHSYECDNPLHYKEIAEMYLCKDDTKKAEELLGRIPDCTLCLSCRYQECYDRLLTLGYAAEFAGSQKEAAEYFAAALRICPTDIECTLCAYYTANPETQKK